MATLDEIEARHAHELEELGIPDGFEVQDARAYPLDDEEGEPSDSDQVIEAGLVAILEALGDLGTVLERIVGRLGELELKVDAIVEDG